MGRGPFPTEPVKAVRTQNLDVGITGPARQDGRVELALSQKIEQMAGVAGRHFHLHGGVGNIEFPQDGREKRLGVLVDGAEADAPADFGRPKRADRLIVEPDHRGGVFEKLEAVGSENVAPPFLFEQRYANDLLEPFHLRGYRRLRLVHLFASPTEAAGFGDCEKGAEEIGIE